MPAAAVRVDGLPEFRRELRKLGDPKPWNKEISTGNRLIALELAPKAQATARASGGQPAHFAPAIRGYGTVAAARLGLASARKGERFYGANAAFWGAKDNITGRNRSDTPNLKVPWVGTSWEVELGQGPRAIVDTIVTNTPFVIDRYGRVIDSVARRAFPD